jgi:hypothetical protein
MLHLHHMIVRKRGHNSSSVPFEKIFKTLSDIFINVLCNQILRVTGFSRRADHVYLHMLVVSCAIRSKLPLYYTCCQFYYILENIP